MVRAVRDILWQERTREEIAAWAQRGAVVIVPIASIEQHGVHLPIDTDYRTAEYVARQAACRAEDINVLVTPVIPFGVSIHHMMFPGTISLRAETVLHVLRDVCESLGAHGFERILILSGHGGNGDTIRAAALELRHQLNRQIQACSWFDLIPEAMDDVREGVGTSIGHSGELETSTILTLSPELVRRERVKLVEGVSDDPALATAAKGKYILDAAVEAVAQLVRKMAASPGRKIVGVETLTKKA
jgi:creatinine amidohydrolase